MKKRILLSIIAIAFILAPTNTNALSGKATIEFTGNDKIITGNYFTVRMNVKDTYDTQKGIVSLEGNLGFNDDIIEYVSARSVNAPYQFYINEKYNYKIAGLDFTLNDGIIDDTTIYEFTFKALKSGNTDITLNNCKITDTQDYVESTIISKSVEVINEEPKVNIEELKIKNEENISVDNKIEKETTISAEKEDENTEIKEEIKENKDEESNEKNHSNGFIRIINIIKGFILNIFNIN